MLLLRYLAATSTLGPRRHESASEVGVNVLNSLDENQASSIQFHHVSIRFCMCKKENHQSHSQHATLAQRVGKAVKRTHAHRPQATLRTKAKSWTIQSSCPTL